MIGNRVNLLSAADILRFHIEMNKAMIEGNSDLNNPMPKLPEEDIKELQGQCIACEEGALALEQLVREDIDYETYCKQNQEAANSQVIIPSDLFDNGVVDY